MLESILESIYILPVLLFSVIIHEIAHGWVALKCGDPTAQSLGRLTLNPIPHIDLVGSIILPLIFIISKSTFFLAWAKPVPINPANFRNYRRDEILVSAAGPLSNLFLAFCCTIIIIILHYAFPNLDEQNNVISYIFKMFLSGISLNVVLAVFNLLPVPPLDGSHILASLLPEKIGNTFRNIGFMGIFIIIFLLQYPPVKKVFYELIGLFLIPFKLILKIFFV